LGDCEVYRKLNSKREIKLKGVFAVLSPVVSIHACLKASDSPKLKKLVLQRFPVDFRSIGFRNDPVVPSAVPKWFMARKSCAGAKRKIRQALGGGHLPLSRINQQALGGLHLLAGRPANATFVVKAGEPL
jgi:hypothetical protein